ncbi:putative nuclease HARBI1 [Prorops nasuta]|uniref:putative nuclease HARBI1 n=1 Tax=Prorops nasuta TaxID=863751 RepID=UPI0034CD87F6
MDEDKVIASAAFIVMHELLNKKKNKRRIWTRLIFKTKSTLLCDLALENRSGQFQKFFRISSEDFEILLNIISPKIQKRDTNYRSCIPAKERLAVTLRFLATGDSYTSLSYLFKISKQSLSCIVIDVCQALIEVLHGYVKPRHPNFTIPSNAEEWILHANNFEQLWNFPHCLGAIDGKHIMIQAPANSGSEYYNYKSFFSIVLFAFVDTNYNFIFTDVGCQGRISDGGFFKNSDEAFSLHENIMKPYSGLHSKGSTERIFNYRLSRARRVIENAFGILSSVFRVLRKPLILEPSKATHVVLATVYLHNFLRRSKSLKQLCTIETAFSHEENGQQELTNPADIRQELASYFVNEGRVSWQNDYAIQMAEWFMFI